MPTIMLEQLRGLILSAADLRVMNPEWTDAMIEDYLTLFENVLLLFEGVNDSITKVPTAPEDNIPVFDDEGEIKDSGESIDTLRARSYFYGRVY